MKQTKNFIALLLLVVLGFNQLFSFVPYLQIHIPQALAAPSSIQKSNLVAVLVDDQIYEKISSEINWYTTEYLANGGNKAISNAQAVVLPINIKNITATEIVKILENLYFDGIKDNPSILKGVILIGDIPLPVVNDNDYIFPTIYPYVDFEKPKFIWDKDLRYFIPNKSTNAQPEVIHGIIQYDNISAYHKFFTKLKKYYKNPQKYVKKRIWYEDLVANKKYYIDDIQEMYINNWLFAEDISYHRYTNLLLKILQQANEKKIQEVLKDVPNLETKDLGISKNTENTPTLMIAKIIKDGLLKPYTSLWSKTYLSRIRENLRYSNRWVEKYKGADGKTKTHAVRDSHIKKTEIKDDFLITYHTQMDNFFIDINNYLEKKINEEIEKQKYYLNIPLPLEYLEYETKYERIPPKIPLVSLTRREKYNAYKNYYFGIPAQDIKTVADTSIYRGTFRNLNSVDGVTISSIQGSDNPATDIDGLDLEKKSVGGSYDIFSQQTEANRGYNMLNTEKELGIYASKRIHSTDARKMQCDGKKLLGICIGYRKRQTKPGTKCGPGKGNSKDCEQLNDFAKRLRGGASPLLMDTSKKAGIDKYMGAISRIFDIAGSSRVVVPLGVANTYKSTEMFANLIQQRFTGEKKYRFTKVGKYEGMQDSEGNAYSNYLGYENKFPTQLPGGDIEKNPLFIDTPPLTYEKADFFKRIKSAEAKKDGGVIKMKEGSTQKGKIRTYKTIDSRVYNINTLPDYVSGKKTTSLISSTPEQKGGDIQEIKTDIDKGIENLLKGISKYRDDIVGINKEIKYIDELSFGGISTGGRGGEYRESVINNSKYLNLEKQIKQIQEQLVYLYHDMAGTQNQIVNMMDDIKEKNTEKEFTKKIYKKFEGKEKQIKKRKEKFSEIEKIYYEIPSISDKMDFKLGYTLECEEGKNVSLCGSFDILVANIKNFGLKINHQKNEIEKFKITNEQKYWYGIDVFKELFSDMEKSFKKEKDEIMKRSNKNGGKKDTSDKSEKMNIMTNSRPIDSPKYVTFKGVGGDLVKLIYPTLYKVEVFHKKGNKKILKTPKEIEGAVADYLIRVVKKYNEYLLEQKNKKGGYFGEHSKAFNMLKQLDPLASPMSPRKYELLPEDFLIRKLEEGILSIKGLDPTGKHTPMEVMAKMLYYQSLPRKKTRKKGNISEQLDRYRDDFDVNKKIEYILEEYLKADNYRGDIVHPEYIDEGYEVAYINSDGDDYIMTKTPSSDGIDLMKKLKRKYKNGNNGISGENGNIGSTDENSSYADDIYNDMEYESQSINECTSGMDGELIIDIPTMSSPWFKAFLCWLKKTKKKPIEVKIEWAANQGTSILGYVDERKQTLEDNKAQRKALSVKEDNKKTLEKLTKSEQQELKEIDQHTTVELQHNSISIDNPNTILSMSSLKSLGKVRIDISSVGKNQVIIQDAKNIKPIEENKSMSFLFDPIEQKDVKILLNPKKLIAGYEVLQINICSIKIRKCLKRSIKLNVVPGKVEKIGFTKKIKKIAAGSSVRLGIFGHDKYGNNVGKLVEQEYIIVVDKGRIGVSNPINKSINFSDFRNTGLLYSAPKVKDKTSVMITIKDKKTKKIIDQQNLIIVPGILKMQMDSSLWTSKQKAPEIKYSLNKISNYKYKDNYDITQINKNALPRISLQLTDTSGQKISTTDKVYVTAENNIILPGKIIQYNEKKNIAGKQKNIPITKFVRNNNFTLENGTIDIYFLPTYKAGIEKLRIKIPGVLETMLSIEVLPGSAEQVKVVLEKEKMPINGKNIAYVTIIDKWGNIVKGTDELTSEFVGLKILKTENDGNATKVTFTTTEDEPGNAVVGFMIKNKKTQNPAIKEIKIDKTYFPRINLNVMYLNMFGNDRGNIWGYFSENKNIVSRMMASSDKLLATTTILTLPKKIQQSVLRISENGQIYTYDSGELTVNNQSINFNIPGVVDLSYPIANIKLQQTTTTKQIKNIDTLYYLPNTIDNIHRKNEVQGTRIILNDIEILDIKNGILAEGTKIHIGQSNNGYTYFELEYNGKIVGEFVLVTQQDRRKITTAQKYATQKIRGEGSTNRRNWIGVFDLGSSYIPKKYYESIEHSLEPKKQIGFAAKFKNISNFGAGLSVGESTLPFGSEFLVNFGDPFIRPIDKNLSLDTYGVGGHGKIPYDGSLGQILKAFPGRSIFKVKSDDIDGDGEKDIIVAFDNGDVNVLKKYNGFRNYQDIGTIIKTDEVKDIFVGDVDANGYPDIIVLSSDNKIYVYSNNNGIFDSEGLPICVGSDSIHPETLQVYDIFVKDMDADGYIDIVVYDINGDIKIIYGGKNSYLSKTKYICDKDWKARTDSHTKIIKSFGLGIVAKNIRDNSLIRWKGLSPSNVGDLSQVNSKELGIDVGKINKFFKSGQTEKSNIIATIMSATQYDPATAIEKFQNNVRRVIKNPFGIHPNYESIKEQIGYIAIQDLKETDIIDVQKKYITPNTVLKNGDKVIVDVNLIAKKDFVGTFADEVKGPRKIHVSDDGGISKFAFDKDDESLVKNNVKIYRNLNKGNYIIDNIIIPAGEKIHRTYELEYISQSKKSAPVAIKVLDKNGEAYKKINHKASKYPLDGLPDILIKPNDGCINKYSILFNTHTAKNRIYEELDIDLEKYMNKKAKQKEKKLQNVTESAIKKVTDAVKDMKFDDIPGVNKLETRKDFGFTSEKFSVKNIVENNGLDLTNIVGGVLAPIGALLMQTNQKLDKFMGKLCNGFGGSGLPIPYNQALFGPGRYHLFGCFDLPPLTQSLGKGLPVMSIPGNWPTPAGTYLPMPNIFGFPFRGPTDGHVGGPQIGTNSSQFRLYMMPTTTAQMGVALCKGPYSAAMAIPSPASDMGGNCVVTAFSMAGDGGDDENEDGDNNTNDDSKNIQGKNGSSENITEEDIANKINNGQYENSVGSFDGYIDDIQTCIRKKKNTGGKTPDSPFIFVKGSQKYGSEWSKNSKNTYFGEVIKFDMDPILEGSSVGDDYRYEKVSIFGGADEQNKILDGDPKGFIKKLIKDWMDRQTRYIENNLTKMNITVVLPNLEGLFEGFGKVTLPTKDTINGPTKNRCRISGGQRSPKKGCIMSDRTKCENIGKKRNGKKCVAGNQRDKNLTKLSNGLIAIQEINNQIKKANDAGILNMSDQIQDVFKEIPLINIRSEDITINIPMITSEQIDAYKGSANEWIKIQQETLKEWEIFIDYFTNECGIDNNVRKNDNKSICSRAQEILQNLVVFKVDAQKLIGNVRENLVTLQEYKKFPAKLYELIHVQDRYLSELGTVINTFVGTLGMWMKTNAIRIAGYIDALTVIITTLQTYQILIDFPVEWREKCGTCTHDTYDQYSCKLSFLCNMKLPIIPIPPFKIPNLRVDLSDFNVGLDIKLPQFNFITHPIPLPDMPNLPSPPDFGLGMNFVLDLDLEIPAIPKPPELPELPSLIPVIKLKLPLIPPAPKIPEIPNQITSIIDIANLIGKIMCIVKNFNMVGESSLKAKVEQLTQRQNEIPIWDMIDFTPQRLDDSVAFVDAVSNMDEAPLKGFDIEISSHVDLQYNFTPVYEVIHAIVDSINGTFQNLEYKLDNVNSKIQEKANNVVDTTKLAINNNTNKAVKKTFEKLTMDVDNSEVLNKKLFNTFTEALQYGQQKYSPIRAKKLRENLKKGLVVLQKTSTNSITRKKTNNLISLLGKDIQVQGGKLGGIQTEAIDTITTHRQKLKKLASNVKNNYRDFTSSIPAMRMVANNTNKTLKGRLFTFNTNNKRKSSTRQEKEYGYDGLSVKKNGVFIPNKKNGTVVSVVKSQDFAQKIAGQYKIEDIDGDNKDDILLRETDTLYIKHNIDTSESIYKGTGKERVYPIESIEQLNTIDGRYINISGIEVKIYTKKYETKNFDSSGISSDSLDVSRNIKNYEGKNLDGYLIRMNNKFDNFFEKERQINRHKEFNKNYILVLPADRAYTGTKIAIRDDIIYIKKNTGGLVDVLEYDTIGEKVDISIPRSERKWKYLQVAGLVLEKDTYILSTPYSNQVVSSAQVSADGYGPKIQGELFRPTTKQKIGSLSEIQGYVGTHYDFNIIVKDNTFISTITVRNENKEKIFSGRYNEPEKKVFIEKIFTTVPLQKKYIVQATDMWGNTTKSEISVNLTTPNIEIKDIAGEKKDNSSLPTKIIAKITHDIDEGIVNFYTKRKNWKIIGGTPKDYYLKPLKTIVVGGTYMVSEDIVFKDQSDTAIARVNPKNGKITRYNDTQDKYIQELKFTQKGPNIIIKNKKTGGNEFKITLPPQELVTVNESVLEKIPLKNQEFGKYDGGRALKRGNIVYMYISPQGLISVVRPLDGRYEFDHITDTVKYYFSSTEEGISEGYMQVKIKDFSDKIH